MASNNLTIREGNYIKGLKFEPDTSIENGFGYFLYEKFKEYDDRIFQVDAITGKSETYGSVLKRSIRCALEMKNRGIKENDVIVMCSGNSMDCFIPIFATQLLNASIAVLDPSQSLRDVKYLLNMVTPKMIFVQSTSLNLIDKAKEELNFKTEIVVMDGNQYTNTLKDFLKPNTNENDFKPNVKENDGDVSFIIFSSGTTGMPKGICLSGRNILSACLSTMQIGIYAETSIHITSFYWISALMVTLPTIIKGNKKIILPQYNLEDFLKAIEQYKISFTILGSHIGYELNEDICKKYDLSSMKLLIFGGSPISHDQLQRCRKFLPNTVILPAYGLTETGGLNAIFPKDCSKLCEMNPGSCGIPPPGITIKIVNSETEEILGTNQLGEIRIFSKFLSTKYYKEDSQKAFDHQGFIKTGDIGYFDQNNFLYICDRIKDMFKYKSWHIVPASVERVIYQHPAVKEAVVVGKPHPTDGDIPMALVVLREGYSNVNEEELLRFINERVLEREQLRGGLKIIKEFPKTPSGKIPRTLVRKQILERTL